MRAQDGVVVKGVHLEVAGPRPLEFGLFECGNAMREGRPQAVLEGIVVRLQRLIVQVIGGGESGDEFRALGTNPTLSGRRRGVKLRSSRGALSSLAA